MFSCRKERLLENVQILYAVMHDFHSVEAAFALDAVRHALQQHEVPVRAAESILEAAKSYLSAMEAAVGESNISKYSAAQVCINAVANRLLSLWGCEFLVLSSDGGADKERDCKPTARPWHWCR